MFVAVEETAEVSLLSVSMSCRAVNSVNDSFASRCAASVVRFGCALRVTYEHSPVLTRHIYPLRLTEGRPAEQAREKKGASRSLEIS